MITIHISEYFWILACIFSFFQTFHAERAMDFSLGTSDPFRFQERERLETMRELLALLIFQWHLEQHAELLKSYHRGLYIWHTLWNITILHHFLKFGKSWIIYTLNNQMVTIRLWVLIPVRHPSPQNAYIHHKKGVSGGFRDYIYPVR